VGTTSAAPASSMKRATSTSCSGSQTNYERTNQDRYCPHQAAHVARRAKGPAAKPSNIERLERALVGKYFHFVFAGGTRFRAGKFESVINDNFFMVRYFAMKTGQLQKFQHIMRLYAEASAETLNGFWVHDTEEDLKETYETFLRNHLKSQEEKAAAGNF
jgi:hypothetical protein